MSDFVPTVDHTSMAGGGCLCGADNDAGTVEHTTTPTVTVTTGDGDGGADSNNNNDADWGVEWDGRSPFWIHCVAGSLAGVTEHVLVYPLDTVRTHIQVSYACLNSSNNTNSKALEGYQSSLSSNPLLRSALQQGSSSHAKNPALPTGMWQTIRYLVNQPAMVEATTAAAVTSASNTTTATTTTRTTSFASKVAGFSRLWVGVPIIMTGCIPGHALYFSSYEVVKHSLTHTVDPNNTGQLKPTPLTLSLAGAAAVFSHDVVMTPLDTIKQRMQLGHYHGSLRTAVTTIYQNEGIRALYRSFPVTLVSNIPYGMLMVSTQERCKQAWSDPTVPAWQTISAASAAGGCVAAALTTPLDRIKTALQTQRMAPVTLCTTTTSAAGTAVVLQQTRPPLHATTTWRDAAHTIWRTEGAAGFFRGVVPRVLSHTPAVAISWTTYETLKQYLLRHYNS